MSNYPEHMVAPMRDELVQVGGVLYNFIDTAGIRRRVKEASGHEFYASLRTQSAIERAEVCVVVIDASETIADQPCGPRACGSISW